MVLGRGCLDLARLLELGRILGLVRGWWWQGWPGCPIGRSVYHRANLLVQYGSLSDGSCSGYLLPTLSVGFGWWWRWDFGFKQGRERAILGLELDGAALLIQFIKGGDGMRGQHVF